MVLHDQPHALGEFVSDVLPASQAEVRGVRKGWIIKEVAGRAFNKSETLLDIASDFGRAKGEAPTVTVKFDVRSSIDCTNGDCKHSDKFPAISETVCAEACNQFSACASWSFKAEEEDTMCWLRRDIGTLRVEAGSVAGTRTCRPHRSWSPSMILAVVVVISLIMCRSASCTQLGPWYSWQQMAETSPTSMSSFMVEFGLLGTKHSHLENEFSPLAGARTAYKSVDTLLSHIEL
jgi:hypothetical protein